MTDATKTIHDLCLNCRKDHGLIAAAFNVIESAPEEERYGLFIQFLLEYKYTVPEGGTKWKLPYPEWCENMTAGSMMDSMNINMMSVDLSTGKFSGDAEKFNRELWRCYSDKSRFSETDRQIILFACAENKELPHTDNKRFMPENAEAIKNEVPPDTLLMLRHAVAQIKHPTDVSDAMRLFPFIANAENEQGLKAILMWIVEFFGEKLDPEAK